MDADRKLITWNKLYKCLYLKEEWQFWDLIDWNNLKKDSSGYYVQILNYQTIQSLDISDEYKEFVKDFPTFKLSGDTDFGSGKVKELQKDVEFRSSMHKFKNFSLMPRSGGMNNAKGTIYNDNFLRFLFVLNEFYLNNKNQTFVKNNLCQGNGKINSESLFRFLNLFDDVYDYCKKIYFIDEELVDEFIDNKNVEDSENSTEKYLAYADKYWIKKLEIMNTRMSLDDYEKYFDQDIETV